MATALSSRVGFRPADAGSRIDRERPRHHGVATVVSRAGLDGLPAPVRNGCLRSARPWDSALPKTAL